MGIKQNAAPEYCNGITQFCFEFVFHNLLIFHFLHSACLGDSSLSCCQIQLLAALFPSGGHFRRKTAQQTLIMQGESTRTQFTNTIINIKL